MIVKVFLFDYALDSFVLFLIAGRGLLPLLHCARRHYKSNIFNFSKVRNAFEDFPFKIGKIKSI